MLFMTTRKKTSSEPADNPASASLEWVDLVYLPPEERPYPSWSIVGLAHNQADSVVLVAADQPADALENMRPILARIGAWVLSHLPAIKERRDVILHDELELLPRPRDGERIVCNLEAVVYQLMPAGTVPGQPEWDEHFKIISTCAPEYRLGNLLIPVAYPSFTFITPAVV